MNALARFAVLVLVIPALRASAQDYVGVGDAPLSDIPSAPIIAGANRCGSHDWLITVAGAADGDDYHITDATGYVDVTVPAQRVSGVSDTHTYVSVTAPSFIDIKAVRARILARSNAVSAFSEWYVLRDVGALVAPILNPIAWTCGLATSVSGHEPGDSVNLYGDGALRFNIPSAFGRDDFMPAGGRFSENESLTADFATCTQEASQLSSAVTVFTYPATLPPLAIASAVEGQNTVTVYGVEAGATVEVHLSRAGGVDAYMKGVCVDPFCRLEVPQGVAPLESGDLVSAQQALCDGFPGSAFAIRVSTCDVGEPPRFLPPRVGDRSLRVFGAVPGSTVRVFVSDSPANPMNGMEQIGMASGVSLIPLYRELKHSDRVVIVAQYLPNCNPRLGWATPVEEQ